MVRGRPAGAVLRPRAGSGGRPRPGAGARARTSAVAVAARLLAARRRHSGAGCADRCRLADHPDRPRHPGRGRRPRCRPVAGRTPHRWPGRRVGLGRRPGSNHPGVRARPGRGHAGTRRAAAVVAGGPAGRGSARRTRSVPHDRYDHRSTAAAGLAPRCGAASDVELPVRPHRGRDLSLRRRRADHLREYPVMVAVGRRRRRVRLGGHDRTGAALSRCTLPDRRAGQRAPGCTVAADGRRVAEAPTRSAHEATRQPRIRSRRRSASARHRPEWPTCAAG